MPSNVESGFYWMGYERGFNGAPWTSVNFPPGTRAFHQWLEGHGDGVKAKALQGMRSGRTSRGGPGQARGGDPMQPAMAAMQAATAQ